MVVVPGKTGDSHCLHPYNSSSLTHRGHFIDCLMQSQRKCGLELFPWTKGWLSAPMPSCRPRPQMRRELMRKSFRNWNREPFNRSSGRHDLQKKNGVPKGIRTPVSTVKGWCPGPLDDGDRTVHDVPFCEEVSPDGFEPSTRTLKVYCSTN